MRCSSPPTEEMVAQLPMVELWSGILGVSADTFSRDDDNFDLGADSVTAMAFVARGHNGVCLFDEVNGLPRADPFSLFAGRETDDLLDLESLMQRDTIPHAKYDRSAIADALPCTAMQMEFHRMGEVHYNIEIDLSDLQIDLRRMQSAVNLLVDCHSILRTVFVSSAETFSRWSCNRVLLTMSASFECLLHTMTA
ncbi:hypothetical protein AC578_7069 [Pseudocercospora eumusae]|uniref:Carrier domain-containing protein n=1 Tax=Pseudocercospora eumusae TaxID=321146 RepID=A0A139HFL8_9PEZI|nr:hypothetical protein AC578_7069 [Pseudocercospora eumusae]